MENIVYLELRRGYNVDVGSWSKRKDARKQLEVDFVCNETIEDITYKLSKFRNKRKDIQETRPFLNIEDVLKNNYS